MNYLTAYFTGIKYVHIGLAFIKKKLFVMNATLSMSTSNREALSKHNYL